MKYVKPTSMQELKDLIKDLKSSNKKYAVIAGGTDLMVSLKNHRHYYSEVEYMLDLSEVKEIKGIKDLGDAVWIGAATTVEELRESGVIRSHFKVLSEASEKFATWQIRNVATVGGNICTSSPASTLAPALLVYDAAVELGPIEERRMPLRDFFKGPKKNALLPYEILTGITLKKQGDMTGAYEEIGKREGNIIPIVNVAVGIKAKKEDGKVLLEDVRIALGSVSPTPVRALSAESFLKGKYAVQENIEEGAKRVLSDISPITDFRASKEYRERMSYVLVKRALNRALGGV